VCGVNRYLSEEGVKVAGFVDSTVKEIDARVKELRAELAKLEAARSALLGSGAPGRRAVSARTATRTRSAGTRRRGSGTRRASAATGGSRRRGGNTRAAQALELVRQKPGITIPEIAQSMGIEPNYLYRVLPRLVGEGQVRRDGQGWHPAN
jgi:hypothetical protein